MERIVNIEPHPRRLQIIRVCNVENCENKHFGCGYCEKHYTRFKKYGNPLFVKMVRGEDRGKHPLYMTYITMKKRCLNTKYKQFKHYGGRGITVCERWLGLSGFNNFCDDMGNRPTNKHSIDRIDNNKGYCPENCRWATFSEQNLNRRNSNKYPYVSFHKCSQKWIIQKKIEGKKKYFGLYDTQAEAVDATVKLGFITK